MPEICALLLPSSDQSHKTLSLLSIAINHVNRARNAISATPASLGGANRSASSTISEAPLGDDIDPKDAVQRLQAYLCTPDAMMATQIKTLTDMVAQATPIMTVFDKIQVRYNAWLSRV